MDRKIVGVSVAAIIAILLFVLLACLIWRGQTVPSTAPITPQSVVESSEAFMKDRLTGGIGLVLLLDAKTGLARVQGVITNSPAQVAGVQRKMSYRPSTERRPWAWRWRTWCRQSVDSSAEKFT